MKHYEGDIYAWRAFKIVKVYTLDKYGFPSPTRFRLGPLTEAGFGFQYSLFTTNAAELLSFNDDGKDGFNSFKSLRRLQKYLCEGVFIPSDLVYAKIRVHGEVIEHRWGYRSTHMDILDFYGDLNARRDYDKVLDSLAWPFPIHSLEGAPNRFKSPRLKVVR